MNLLREGLDLPEVSLVIILDADKEGFLRSHRSLTQTIGRAARNINGRAIMYANRVTKSMKKTIDETSYRRKKQNKYNKKLIPIFVSVFFIWQVLIPLRSFSYPGELFWTEQGYRFSWRVMLIEKAGYTTFKIVDNSSGNSELVDNSLYLTKFQEKQMSFQPDMIIEYAHYLGDTYKKKGFKDVSVYAESYVTLNGRPSQRFIDPGADLYNEKINFKNKKWILPFKDEIKSFL